MLSLHQLAGLAIAFEGAGPTLAAVTTGAFAAFLPGHVFQAWARPHPLPASPIALTASTIYSSRTVTRSPVGTVRPLGFGHSLRDTRSLAPPSSRALCRAQAQRRRKHRCEHSHCYLTTGVSSYASELWVAQSGGPGRLISQREGGRFKAERDFPLFLGDFNSKGNVGKEWPREF